MWTRRHARWAAPRRRRRGALAVAGVAAAAAAFGTPVGSSPETTSRLDAFDIGLIGDTGYTAIQERALLAVRADMNDRSLAFVVHAGDIWAQGAPCDEDGYRRVRDVFDGFVHPFVYTPGDNEWSDCPGGAERLEVIRRTFFPTNETLGRRRMTVTRQRRPFVENARWDAGGVVFVTVNEPGPAGASGSGRDANVDWLEAAFDEADAAGAAAVMVIWQDNPFEPSGGRLARALKERAAGFGGPVILVHGDTHHHRVDRPWADVPNFRRVEVYGDTSEPNWVRATVDPSDPDVFSFRTERAPDG